MTCRMPLTLTLSATLVFAPVAAPTARAQQPTSANPPGDTTVSYVVPIGIAVVLGALAWPLVAPAVAITADNVAAGGAGTIAARAAAPAVRAATWTWNSVLASRVVGGVVGGLAAYGLTP
jgi:predicted deacylase